VVDWFTGGASALARSGVNRNAARYPEGRMFDVAASSYDAFMGRWSRLLSAPFTDFAEVEQGSRVVDVGAGTGALTAELVARAGVSSVVAVDPSPSFVRSLRERFDGVPVEQAPAESLPFADSSFDVALAQLVVHFMQDPVAGLREMARVVAPGGVVAASVWDYAGKRDPLRQFWAAARDLDPDLVDESLRAGTAQGHLADLMSRAGLSNVVSTDLTVELEFASFDDWWAPFESSVGPAGIHFANQSAAERARLRDAAHGRFGQGPTRLSASAWAARGVVPV
jgi:SAM-dependent methyltransferase